MKRLLLLAALLATPALAHDWYPRECCGGVDCGPATMRTVAGGTYRINIGGKSIWVTGDPFISEVTVTYTAGEHAGKSETVVVPPNLARRESPDSRMHGCVVR